MSTMPYWLAKTPEIIAMDRWFSLQDAGSDSALITRYHDTITRLNQSTLAITQGSATTLDQRLPGGAPAAAQAFAHFKSDWINVNNLSSGGDYWPQIPSFSIILWLTTGVKYGARKALGIGNLPAGDDAAQLFEYEIDDLKLSEENLSGVLPLVTCWICTNGANFEVDAVRGPTAVSLVISTPPPYQKAHAWNDVKGRLDEVWARIHPDMGEDL